MHETSTSASWKVGPVSAEVAMLHPAIKPKRANLFDKTSIDGTSKCLSSVLTHDGWCTLVNRRRKNDDAGEGRIRSSLQSTHDNNLGVCGHEVNNKRNAALHTSLYDRMPTPPEDIGGAFS